MNKVIKRTDGPQREVAEPLVSFITMSYNYGRYIGDTILSVLGQDYKRIQYVIVDDCSSDNSVEVIKQFRDPRIKFVELERNGGAGACYARAYQEVEGDFVCSVDADDIITPNKTSLQLAFFKKNPSYDLVTSYIDVIDAEGAIVPGPTVEENWVNQERDLSDLSLWSSQNYVAHSAVMMRRAAHDAVGCLDPSMIYTPDYDHFARFVAHGCKFGLTPDKLLKYRVHGNNNTHKNPMGTFLEMAYTYWRWLLPILVRHRRFPEIARRFKLIGENEQFARMDFDRRMRLLAAMTSDPRGVNSFEEFLARVDQQPVLGGAVMEALLDHTDIGREFRTVVEAARLRDEGVEWWREQSNSVQRGVDQWVSAARDAELEREAERGAEAPAK